MNATFKKAYFKKHYLRHRKWLSTLNNSYKISLKLRHAESSKKYWTNLKGEKKQ